MRVGRGRPERHPSTAKRPKIASALLVMGLSDMTTLLIYFSIGRAMLR